MDAPDPAIDELPRLVARSRLVAALAFVLALALFIGEPTLVWWVWLGTAAAAALSHVGIVAWVRRSRGPARARALRRAMILVTVPCFALAIPLASMLGPEPMPSRHWPEVGMLLAALALAPAATGWIAVSGSLPADLRETETPHRAWRPSPRAKRMMLLVAWPLGTLFAFWLLTGLTTDTDCVVDGGCSMGVPHRFAHFGGHGGRRSMDWLRFAQDLGILATLLPAAYAVATARMRWVFALYLLAVSLVLGMVAAEDWGGLYGLEMASSPDTLLRIALGG